MSWQLKWEALIPRLEDDLLAGREAGGRWRDDRAWEAARLLLRAKAPWALIRHAGFVSPTDVEDLVQNVLLKLQNPNTIRRMKASRSPAGYVLVILRNAAIDYGQAQRRPEFESLTWREHDPLVEGAAPRGLSAEEVVGLAEALGRLTDGERSLLEMRFWQNLGIAEIAKETGKNYSATAVSLFRLLRRLRALINTPRG